MSSPVIESASPNEFFLGGSDLEMVTIRELLLRCGEVVHDRRLPWGAKASAYADEIAECRAAGHIPVLIELIDDLNLGSAVETGAVVLIDHHGDRAGKDKPTALEQIFQLLECPPTEWSRHFDLVAANDRGHVQGMLALKPPATAEELQTIREADRRAQGITADHEAAGRIALAQQEQYLGGKLTVVRLPHPHGATITDPLETALGGPGFENLVILTPSQTLFYGAGDVIHQLQARYPESWSGGELPIRGYWGINCPLDVTHITPLIGAVRGHETGSRD